MSEATLESLASARINRRKGTLQSLPKRDVILTVFRLPSGLHNFAPIKTPGNAMAPRRSCHSAVCLRSPSLMMLEMIVPEKTPLGNVTCSRVTVG